MKGLSLCFQRMKRAVVVIETIKRYVTCGTLDDLFDTALVQFTRERYECFVASVTIEWHAVMKFMHRLGDSFTEFFTHYSRRLQ